MLRRSLLTGVCVSMAANLVPSWALAAPVDDTGLGTGRYARMHLLLEKTFLQIDILRVELRLDQKTADTLEKIVKGQKHSAELEGRVVAIALRSRDAYTEVEFLHGIPTNGFVEGIRTDIGRAYKGKLIDEAEHDRVRKGVAGWFAFLGERGVEEGDRLYHRGRRSGVRTVYIDNAGKKQMDLHFPGALPTRTLIASYLAPGGELRSPLVRSLFDEPADAS